MTGRVANKKKVYRYTFFICDYSCNSFKKTQQNEIWYMTCVTLVQLQKSNTNSSFIRSSVRLFFSEQLRKIALFCFYVTVTFIHHMCNILSCCIGSKRPPPLLGQGLRISGEVTKGVKFYFLRPRGNFVMIKKCLQLQNKNGPQTEKHTTGLLIPPSTNCRV